jgi:hypothetical protein
MTLPPSPRPSVSAPGLVPVGPATCGESPNLASLLAPGPQSAASTHFRRRDDMHSSRVSSVPMFSDNRSNAPNLRWSQGNPEGRPTSARLRRSRGARVIVSGRHKSPGVRGPEQMTRELRAHVYMPEKTAGWLVLSPGYPHKLHCPHSLPPWKRVCTRTLLTLTDGLARSCPSGGRPVR